MNFIVYRVDVWKKNKDVFLFFSESTAKPIRIFFKHFNHNQDLVKEIED